MNLKKSVEPSFANKIEANFSFSNGLKARLCRARQEIGRLKLPAVEVFTQRLLGLPTKCVYATCGGVVSIAIAAWI